jgi:hypothetical protein
MAYRLGWVLYWGCLALAAAWVLLLLGFVGVETIIQGIEQAPFGSFVAFSPALILYGLGRALRYVLSNE